MNRYNITIQHAEETDEMVIQFPEELLESLGWKTNDTVEFKVNKDGSILVFKTDAPIV
jgi:bifunctional DNA-binding transcriptional regulator/antitoxin component of YhaV-PrlF toxin-antitoxin module